MPHETITVPTESKVRVKKCGVGFAGLDLRITPIEDHVVQLRSEVPATELPERFLQAFFEGIRERVEAGIIQGHPIQGVEVTLLWAETHPDHSTKAAFKLAGNSGFESAFRDAGPIVVDD